MSLVKLNGFTSLAFCSTCSGSWKDVGTVMWGNGRGSPVPDYCRSVLVFSAAFTVAKTLPRWVLRFDSGWPSLLLEKETRCLMKSSGPVYHYLTDVVSLPVCIIDAPSTQATNWLNAFPNCLDIWSCGRPSNRNCQIPTYVFVFKATWRFLFVMKSAI